MVSRPRRSEPAGVTDSTASPAFAMYATQLLRLVVGNVHANAARARKVLELLGGLQNILFALFAEARKVAQFAFARELRDAIDGADFEIAPEKRDLFWAERLQMEQVEQRGRIFLQQLLAQA